MRIRETVRLRGNVNDEFEVVAVLHKASGRNGRLSWGGTIEATTGEMLFVPVGQYSVLMPDGREGTLIVKNDRRSAGFGVGVVQTVEVLGSGEPPF